MASPCLTRPSAVTGCTINGWACPDVVTVISKEKTFMIESSTRRLRWGYLATFGFLALIACIIFLLQREDSAVTEAIDKLQIGMTDVEAWEVLKPVHHMKQPPKDGSGYIFYGTDGFVTVVMGKDGESWRVVNVIRQPDGGPWWERVRRKWEHRLR